MGYLGCTNGVYGVDFSNRGSLLAVAGGDASIKIVQVPQ